MQVGHRLVAPVRPGALVQGLARLGVVAQGLVVGQHGGPGELRAHVQALVTGDRGRAAELISDDCGLIVADAFGGAVVRDATAIPLAPARRKALEIPRSITRT
mgnify:CR=1 FL=1